MNRVLRALVTIAIASGGLLACAQLIGLDDTKDRAVATSSSSSSSSSSGAPPTTPPATPTCTSNRQCMAEAGFATALCVEQKCVQLNRELCPEVYPSFDYLENDDVLLLASFVPTQTLSQQAAAYAYKLAIHELEQASGVPTTPRRLIAMALCQSYPEKASDAVKHVVNDLKVPAIIAGFGATDLTNIVGITRRAGVFVLNPSVAPSALKYDTEEDDLFWSLLGTTDDVAVGYAPLVDQLSRHIKRQREPDAGADAGDGGDAGGADTSYRMKVALINTLPPGEVTAGDVVVRGAHDDRDGGAIDIDYAVRVNDTPARDAPITDFRRWQFDGDELKKPTDPTFPSNLFQEVVSFAPDIVIALTYGEIDRLVQNVDNQLSAAKKPLPYWLLGQRNAHVAGLLSYLQNEAAGPDRMEARLARFLGLQFAGNINRQEHDEWLRRMTSYHTANGAKIPIDISSSENFYDAVYWIAFGLYAGKLAEKGIADNRAISKGVRLLLAGSPVRPGDPDILNRTSFPAIKDAVYVRNETATFIGAMGPPDIDPRYGVWRSFGAVYCYPPPTDAGVQPRYDVQWYDAASRTFEVRRDDNGNSLACNQYQ